MSHLKLARRLSAALAVCAMAASTAAGIAVADGGSHHSARQAATGCPGPGAPAPSAATPVRAPRGVPGRGAGVCSLGGAPARPGAGK